MLEENEILDLHPLDAEYVRAVTEWSGIDLATSSPMEIRNYLLERPFGECSLCEQCPTFEDQRQLTQQEYESVFHQLEGKWN